MYKARQTIFIFLFSIISSLSITAFAQKNYESGYIVTNQGDTIRGYINNKDWRKNPKSIRFKKMVEDNSPVLYNPLKVSSFYISSTNEWYIGAIVDIDKLPAWTERLLEVNNVAEFFSKNYSVKDTIFLNIQVKGRANFYTSEDSDGRNHFFIQKDTGKIEELINQRYIVDSGTSGKSLKEYAKYKTQLEQYLVDCPQLNKELAQITYNKKQLQKLLINYNSCISSSQNVSSETYVKTGKNAKLKIGVLAGLSLTNLRFEGPYYLSELSFSSSLKPTVGISAEIILPRNHGAWSIYNDVIFKSFSFTELYPTLTSPYDVILECSYLKIASALRYTYPKGTIQPFATIGVTNAFVIKTTNKLKTSGDEGRIALPAFRNYEQGLIGGIGLLVKRASIEARFERSNGMSGFSDINSPVTSLYILLGFRFN